MLSHGRLVNIEPLSCHRSEVMYVLSVRHILSQEGALQALQGAQSEFLELCLDQRSGKSDVRQPWYDGEAVPHDRLQWFETGEM
jgi:hypothetical protein